MLLSPGTSCSGDYTLIPFYFFRILDFFLLWGAKMSHKFSQYKSIPSSFWHDAPFQYLEYP